MVSGLLLAALWTASASAGEYHNRSSLHCGDCHSMHFSQSHGWASTPTPQDWLGSGPNVYLLKTGGGINGLCLACHDGQTFAPDVRGANSSSYVRQAGAITTGSAPYQDWKGHTLDGLVTPPGGFMSLKLECTSCHAYHGNNAFRNVDAITYAKGTNDPTKDVFLRSWTAGDLEGNYSVDSVDFNEPDSRSSKLSAFCRGCHTDFHGAAGDANMGGAGGQRWKRHPTADANIGQFEADSEHSSLSVFESRLFRVKVMSASGDWGVQGVAWSAAPPDLTPNCMTCHKAHGNQNPFGLITLKGTGPLTEEGDAAGQAEGLKALCGQCHVQ